MRGISTLVRPCATSLLAVMLAAALCPFQAFAAQGASVVHKKSGMDIEYTIVRDAGPGQGSVQLARIPDDAKGALVVPASIMVMQDWEKPATYAVEGIAARAFSGASAASGELTRISIVGQMEVDPDAFVGLAETTTFVVGDEVMAKRLRDAGIASGRIAIEPLLTLYVAFGDSIAAGYALDAYNNDNKCEDEMPTPPDAFVSLLGEYLDTTYGPSFTDNLAASGWTSTQLLDALRSGMYDAALADATLVSVTIGSNDLLGRFIEIIAEALQGIEDLSEEDIRALEAAPEQAPSTGSVEAAPLAKARPKPVQDLVDKIVDAIAQINTTIANDPDLLAACETFKSTNQPAILAELHKRAPKAQVYWTTLYNPFYGQTFDLRALFPRLASKLVDDEVNLSIDLSGAGARYIELMNQAFTQNTKGYVPVDLYEPFNHPNLTNVSIGRAQDGSIMFNVDPHPNHDGHALIARLMKDAIAATYHPSAPQPDVPPAPTQTNTTQEKPRDTLAPTGDTSAYPLLCGIAVAAGMLVAGNLTYRACARRRS